MALTWSFETDA